MPTFVSLVLSSEEALRAAGAGVMRRNAAIQNDRENLYGVSDTVGRWENDVVGCLAELAVAKALGVHWDEQTHYVPDAPDVGDDIEVRGTNHPKGGLICHPKDKDHRPFVCVRVLKRRCDIVGWLWGYEAKDKRRWRDPQPGRFCFLTDAPFLRKFSPATFLIETAFGPPIDGKLLEAAE